MASAPGVRYTHRKVATHSNQHHAIFRAPPQKSEARKSYEKARTEKSEPRKSYEKSNEKVTFSEKVTKRLRKSDEKVPKK